MQYSSKKYLVILAEILKSFILQVYRNITDEVVSFFAEMGVTQVTVQPEFHKVNLHFKITLAVRKV